MLFTWDEKYNVNVKVIDDQHKKLVDYINELDEAIRVGEGKEVLEDLLKDLIDYTHTHFATEERLMIDYGYPRYKRHKKEHDDLTKHVLNIQNKFLENDSIAVTLHAMKFLSEWLDNHLLGTDKLYVKFFESKGLR